MAKIHYVVNEDWAFISHFFERAVAAQEHGYQVAISAHCGEQRFQLIAKGFEVFPHNISRSGTNPISELKNLFALLRDFRNSQPDIIHLIALKPIVIGAIAARVYGKAKVVCAPIGMGYLFSSNDRKARFVQPIVRFLLKRILTLRNTQVIIENNEDRDSLVNGKYVIDSNIHVIKGAGVDLDRYLSIPENLDSQIVSMFSRVLRDKGVSDFARAAQIVHRTIPHATFRLIGDCDLGNPSSFTKEEVQAWVSSGAIEWLGYRSDVPELLGETNIVCLPSYREGLPKTLIEACAAQRAIVATDVTGCREAVSDGFNGLLVPAKSPELLASAITHLLTNQDLRLQFARNGRSRAENEFASSIVVHQTLKVYESMLSNS